MKEAESNEEFFYRPVQLNQQNDEEEHFADATEAPKPVSSPPVKSTPIAPPPTTTNNNNK